MKSKRLLLIPALMFGFGGAFAMPIVNNVAAYAATNVAETGETSVNLSSGVFTTQSESKLWSSHWKSNQTNPTIEVDCGKNNMSLGNSNETRIQAFIGNGGSCAYNITVSEGWLIKSYKMDVALVDAAKAVTVQTPDGQNHVITSDVQTITIDNINSAATLFTLVGGNNGVNITNWTVSYVKDNSAVKSDLRTFTVFDNANSSVPYRIPAIGKAQNGDLVAVADYRYSKGDIGTGKLDLRLRRSTDNGETWEEMLTPDVFKGDGKNEYGNDFVSGGSYATNGRHDACAFGDPCIVGDRESARMMITSCSGYPGFGQGTNTYHQGWARWYSNDNGKTWEGPTYLDEEFVYQPLREAGHNIQGFFIGSGKIHQSRYIKLGNYYRLYCAGLSQTGGSKENWVFYSDDFGETWKFLGGTKTSPLAGGDEPKVEELPNGNVILSSRTPNGRYYNIFTFSDANDGESGAWGVKALSNSSVNGLVASESFGTNGEIQILPAVNKTTGEKTFLALQSLPTNGRANVKIFYKDLGNADTYATPANFAKDWNGSYQVSTTSSAYSTWCLQADNTIGCLYEESSYNNGYNIVYKHLSVETITSDNYSFDADYKYEKKDINLAQAERNQRMETLLEAVNTGVDANSTYVEGEKLITSASQLSCPWGCKEQKPATSSDVNWTYDIYDIDNLIDGNASTYYHTVWQNGDVVPGTHYLDVTATDAFAGTIGVYVTRRQATDDHITEFTITGTNDSENFENVAVVTMPNAESGAESKARFFIADDKSYGKLRFNVTATNSGRGYWHMAEFQLRQITLDTECLNAKCGEVYKSVLAAIATAEQAKGHVSEDDLANLQAAYDAYLEAINVATAITNVNAQDIVKTSKVYDLQGRRVTKATKGVFIIDGKKVVR